MLLNNVLNNHQWIGRGSPTLWRIISFTPEKAGKMG